MNSSEILSHVEHTLLKAFATWEDIQKLCEEAMEYHTASVCVPPSYIKRIHDTYGEKINICTVVGFPLGYSTTKAKVAETVQAIEDGVAGGTESDSNRPHLMEKARVAYQVAPPQWLVRRTAPGALNVSMGTTAENLGRKYHITREGR